MDSDGDGYLLLKDIDNMVDAEFAKCCCCRGWLKEVIFWRIDQATNDGRIDIHEWVQFCLKFRRNQTIKTERRESKQALIRAASRTNAVE